MRTQRSVRNNPGFSKQ